ncbi:Glycosyl hydrolases family 38 C-terminal domain-containing protein [Paramicrobacterium humi]|uniref:Glycosyl hydrolases family 38 C-terminal domain-containing protein n=1 Tax=Paramicrobacterium humi TaxID=640635 RepID=A0A1H4KHJ8_9MICO|nr:hypothetical protein [Microbacterium humi]SEB58034.1 Glycosyl hydrolases family 38 C-terminal domain-containing protein [Microbacterium humi]
MSRIRQLLLVAHTHHDVGYTNSPRIIDRQHERIVSEVLSLCDASPGQGPDRFRWTFEVSRPVLRFLAHASADDVARLRRQVRAGDIAVTGGYLNMTQLPSTWEFETAYDALSAFAAAGIPVRTEQHGDVNGIAWGTIPAMRRAGIERLVMALNPDHGRAPFPQPSAFWWEGPSGERLFTLLSTHYGYGEEWGIVDGDCDLAERRIRAFVDELEKRDDYPFDSVVVHAGNDNRWPTTAHLDIVRHWNERHPDVPMRTATIDDALDVLQGHPASAGLPVYRGEWSDWWAHGHGSTAREVAVYREARSFARAAQASHALVLLDGTGTPALATVLGYRRGPVLLRSPAELLDDLAHVDEQLLLFGEHTWGSWETYSKPHSNLSHSHWNAKAGFAYDAFDHARDLAIEGLYRLAAAGSEHAPGDVRASGILVFNPSERERTEPIAAEIDGARRVRVVATVPPFGLSLLQTPDAAHEQRRGRVIETARYRVEVDPAAGGVVSLLDKRTGRELVDSSAAHALGAVVCETVPSTSTHPMVTRSPKDFHPEDPGPDFERTVATGADEPVITETDTATEISWTTSVPGLLDARGTLVLYAGTELVDYDVHIAKPESFAPRACSSPSRSPRTRPSSFSRPPAPSMSPVPSNCRTRARTGTRFNTPSACAVRRAASCGAASMLRSCNSADSTRGSGRARSMLLSVTSTAGS